MGRQTGNSAQTVQAATVGSFLESLDHPLRQEIEAVRRMIREAVPTAGEEIKWNAPSFYTSEHFATLHLRNRNCVQVVLHLGARPRAVGELKAAVADPHG